MNKYVEEQTRDGVRKIDDNKYLVTMNGYTHIFDKEGLDEFNRIVHGKLMPDIE